MAFKLGPAPYNLDNTPIYTVDLGNDILGKANNNGTILLNKNLHPSSIQKVIIKLYKKNMEIKLSLTY